MKRRTILVTILITCLYSCQRKDNTEATPASVVISISSPTEGHVYHAGDTIAIVADVSYPSELHGYELKITDSASGTILYDSVEHVHSDHFSISDKWVKTGSQYSGLKLSLVTAIDHDGNTAEKDINFRYQP